MDSTSTLHIVRVFCAEDGSHGNPLGVFLDGVEVPDGERQAVAADLGYAETVFVDDAAGGEMRIFTPALELPLAGHPLVGTAWLLAQERKPVSVLRPPAGEVTVRYDDDLTSVAADPAGAPPFEHLQLDSPAAVDALTGPPEGIDWAAMWAWIDEPAGLIRKRVFVRGGGIAEDEATGSAAMLHAAQLGREIEIHQGQGSIIYGRPLDDGRVEISGRVVLDETREYG